LNNIREAAKLKNNVYVPAQLFQ